MAVADARHSGQYSPPPTFEAARRLGRVSGRQGRGQQTTGGQLHRRVARPIAARLPAMFSSCSARTRVGEDLRAKALLALEEALHECRYRPVHRSRALAMALAYLWDIKRGDPRDFAQFWREIASDNYVLRFRGADQALERIYASADRKRDDELSHSVWREVQARVGPGGPDCRPDPARLKWP
jgi:hypothetical protein